MSKESLKNLIAVMDNILPTYEECKEKQVEILHLYEEAKAFAHKMSTKNILKKIYYNFKYKDLMVNCLLKDGEAASNTNYRIQCNLMKQIINYESPNLPEGYIEHLFSVFKYKAMDKKNE